MSWLDLTRFHFASPAVLWWAAALPLLVLMRERSRAGLSPWRTFSALVLRSLALLALLVAAAGPYEETTRPDRSVAIVLDGSASIGAARAEAAARWLREFEAERGEVPTVFVVAGERLRAFDDLEEALVAGRAARSTERGTELASGLELALARLPAARVREVVLLSDGATTRGDLRPALRVASARDVPVHVVPLVDRTLELELADGEATQDTLVGDVVTLSVRASASAEVAVDVALLQAGHRLDGRATTLDASGSRVALSFTPQEPGVQDVVVVARVGDIEARHPLRVRVRPRPSALVVGADGAASALRTAIVGYRPALDIAQSARLPQGPYRDYSMVALLDPDLPALGSERIAALAEFVREGGRLLVTGGEHGLVTDEPVVEPLADVLPVRFAKRKKKQRAPLAVIYCLDTSDSMAGGAKFELAAAALAQSLYLLPESARVGVIGFSDFPSWLVPLSPFVGSATVIDALAAVNVRGGTSIYHALQDAYDALREDEALVKHVILLSDGQSTTTFARSGDIVTAMKRRDITVSSIAVTQDSDRSEMERISRAGGGRAHYTESFSQLPRLFLDEMMEVTRTNKVDESFVVHAVHGSPLLARVPDGLPWPALDGFVRGEQKAGSELALATGDGRPILVQGRYGRGQVTLFTSDVGGPWSEAWAGWKGASPLWEGVVDAILRPQPPRRVTLETQVEGAEARLLFAALDDLRNPRADLRVEAILEWRDGAGERSATVPLTPTGPGRYGADVPLARERATLIRVAAVGLRTQEPGAAPPPGGELVVSLSPAPPEELRSARANPSLLREVAAATSGLYAPSPSRVLERAVAERVEREARWHWPLWAAMVLILADLGSRRLRLPRPR